MPEHGPGARVVQRSRSGDAVRVRRVLIAVVVIFVLYAVITQPQNSAVMTRNAGSGLASGADTVATRLMQFTNALMR